MLQDLRFGVRALVKNKGFTSIAIVTLALGIGANTAIFSVVNTILLRPLAYADPDQLVLIYENNHQKGWNSFAVAPGNFVEWRSESRLCREMAAFGAVAFNLMQGGEPEQLRGASVSASLFAVLGATPSLGRHFLEEEDRPDGDSVVMLSHSLWHRRFGGDPGVLGRALALDGKSYTVIGVMPAGFAFPNPRIELWVPLALSSEQAVNRGGHYLGVVARMADTATVSAVQTEMDGIAARLEETYTQTNSGWGVVVSSLNEAVVGDIRRPLQVLVCAVAFVLLIACANVASLLLARGSARATEIAIRSALGASRSRLVRQLLTESVCLSLVGAALGVALASWGIDALVSLAPANIPRLREVGIDGSALGFTLAISVLTAIIFGLAPALQLTKVPAGETLKEGGRGQSGSSTGRLARKVLVVAEVALSLVLLIGAGLMIQSFIRLRAVEPGFQSDRILTGSISLPEIRYREPHKQADFFRELVSRASSMPGAETAAVVMPLPFVGDSLYGFLVEGRPSDNPPSANYYAVSDTYFDAMRIPLVKGRFFTESDSLDRPRVAIINETMANRYFPGEEPIGKRMHITNGPTAFREIVGVVGDVKQYGLNTTTPAQMYEPYLQSPRSSMHLVVRAAGEPSGLYSAVRDQVRSLDAEQPIANLQTLDHIVAMSIAPERFSMLLLTIFAGLAFILAAVGIYGLMSYQVGRRTHEIGLRVALGASGADVLKLVVGQGMRLALIGVTLGVIGALALTHLMSTLLFEVNPQDPLVFAVVSMLFTGIALLACYIPARRATRVDPMEALRYE